MATHTIVGNQIQYSPISSQADAIRAAIGAAKLTTVAEGTSLSATKAFAYVGTTVKYAYVAKEFGSVGNGYTIAHSTAASGTPATVSVSGPNITITAGLGQQIADVASVVNAIEGLPVELVVELRSGIDSGPNLFVAGVAVATANGLNGLSGKLGDRVVATSSAGYLVFECVSETPAVWRPISRELLTTLTDSNLSGISSQMNVTVPSNSDRFVFIDSPSCTGVAVSFQANPVFYEGQTISIISSRDVEFSTFNVARSSGDVPTVLLRNTMYTAVCTNSKALGRWLFI